MHHSEYTHRSDYGTKIKEDNPKCYIPDRPNWAPLPIIRKRNIVTTTFLVELPLELGSSPALVSSAPATVLVESVSREDSAISHPRDQDYLSLWVR